MSNLHPFPNCPLDCALKGNPLCVRKLIRLTGAREPITLGLRIGLNHVYGEDAMPPCVRGTVGSAYWSTEPSDEPFDLKHRCAA